MPRPLCPCILALVTNAGRAEESRPPLWKEYASGVEEETSGPAGHGDDAGVMGVSPALAYHDVGHNFHSEAGNKSDNGADANKGGGQEHTRNGHPSHGGGEKHGGGKSRVTNAFAYDLSWGSRP
jgi:hypothetical protein